ncbi:NU1M oxidoreductase, partial [Acromyrmex insinuator]
MPLFLIFLVKIITKLNRRAVDFVECASELVSGFNVEYFRSAFALIFSRIWYNYFFQIFDGGYVY